MGMSISGAELMITRLRNIAKKVPDHARRTMNNAADKIVVRAKLFCPRDTGALEDSIHKEVVSESNQRLAINIVAGEGLAYAVMIHENYDDDHPGPNTAAKREANPGVDIGSHFLTRAVEEQKAKMEKMMIEAVTSAIEETK